MKQKTAIKNLLQKSYKAALLIACSIGFISCSNAQMKEKHQWTDRLILVLAETDQDNRLEQQVELLLANKVELHDRKLVVYQIVPDRYKNNKQKDWRRGSTLYENYSSGAPFEVILIGLDGGEKLRKAEVTDPATFFDLIDQMPMRRNELRNR